MNNLEALVLLVDDDPELRELTQGYLQDNGFRVLTAGDGQEALRILQSSSEPVLLVICDMIMPRMNGGELHLAMRTLNPALKFLMISGHPDQCVRNSALLGPDTPVIEKPWSGKELLCTIRTLLATEAHSAAQPPPVLQVPVPQAGALSTMGEDEGDDVDADELVPDPERL